MKKAAFDWSGKVASFSTREIPDVGKTQISVLSREDTAQLQSEAEVRHGLRMTYKLS